MKVNIIFAIGTFLISPLMSAKDKLVFSSFESSTEPVSSVLTEAYRRIGKRFEIRQFPSARSLAHSNSGKFDGELRRTDEIQKKYKNLIMIPVPVFVVKIGVFTNGLHFKVDGWNSLKPYKIGIMIGMKLVEEKTKGMKTIAVGTVDQLIKMLYNKRIDIAVIGKTVWTRSMNRLKQNKTKFDHHKIKMLTPPVQVTNLYHYLHKKKQKT